MEKKSNYIIVFILLVLLASSFTGFGLQSYRLVETRRQLDTVRMELSTATNRQSELAEILRRDGEIIRESSTTIAGIRSQIAVIRDSYEKMENILAGNNHSGDK